MTGHEHFVLRVRIPDTKGRVRYRDVGGAKTRTDAESNAQKVLAREPDAGFVYVFVAGEKQPIGRIGVTVKPVAASSPVQPEPPPPAE